MQLNATQLAARLSKKEVLPVYLLSGDEPLQIKEAADEVRAAAREAGCAERDILDASEPDRYDWNALQASGAEQSLFGERKLIELRIPTGKPGMGGSKAIVQYLETRGDNVLLIEAGKIDKAAMNSKWVKAIDQAGAVLRVWPVNARELPGWLKKRLAAAGLEIDPDALDRLCGRVEGNLLAANQEVEKLRLLCEGGRVSAADVENVAGSARYSLFEMTDQALLGNTARALRMLNGLRDEGAAPPAILWAPAREIRLLSQCRAAMDRDGLSSEQAMRKRGVWQTRTAAVGAALKRHTQADLEALLRQAHLADQTAKGGAPGNPWDCLGQLLLRLGEGAQ